VRISKEQLLRGAGLRNKLAAELLPQPLKCAGESVFFLWYVLPEPWTGRAFEEQARGKRVNLFCAEKFVAGGLQGATGSSHFSHRAGNATGAGRRVAADFGNHP